MNEKKLSIARDIMVEFAQLTGLSPEKEDPRRYLWTDAFAVCNFLELYRLTGEANYRDLALLLVDQVHGTLGRHRKDDARTGWISGLDDQEGTYHPTIGGLRIGKRLNERKPDEPFDDRLEWDRDGQYYHYLTKWMHALHRTSAVTGDQIYRRWAVELAKTAHARFTYARSVMHWKMSIDLSYPLVASMGQHDPLDGLITYHELQAGFSRDSKEAPGLDLSAEIAELAGICRGRDWTTHDSLGIGGLLSDAYRVMQLRAEGVLEQTDLLRSILDASLIGLGGYMRSSLLNAPASYRLAFREFGLAIGLQAVERMQQLIERKPGIFGEEQQLHRQLESLMGYQPHTELIEDFWLMPGNREASSFIEHRDINMVMLATTLIPDGYLVL